MIGKIPKTGKGFRGSFNYLMRGRREAENPERLSWMETRNLFLDDREKIPRMMRATAAQSRKCQKPVYHFLVSWRDDEAPSDVIMRQVADRALNDLGLNDHQAVLAAHRDTRHRHLHILVNRVHPETGKAWHTGKDWERLERSIARQALELGFIKVDGRHNTPEKMAREAKRARDSEYQMATRKKDIVPIDRWSVDEIRSRRLQLGPLFDQARSWDDLARLLAAEGLALTAKGQGLVIEDGYGFMKLSDLGKQVRLKGLETNYRETFADFDRRRGLEPTPAAERNDQWQMRSPVVEQQRPLRTRQPARKPAGDSSDADDPTSTQHEEKDAKANSDYAEQQAREAEREQLRAAWLEARRAAQSARTPPPKPADTSDDTGAPPQRERPSAPTSEATPRQEARSRLADAHEALDFTRKLHEMGLVSKQDLIRARDDVAAAREDAAQHQTFGEFVQDGVHEALTGVGKPQAKQPSAPKPKPKPPQPEKPFKPQQRKKDRDRDR